MVNTSARQAGDPGFDSRVAQHPYLIIGWEDGVLGPGGIWGRVQGVGSDHWGTRSQP